MRNQKLAGAALSYVQLGIKVVIAIVYTPIMLHYLGDGEYGVYSVATSVISFLAMLDLGFGQTLIHFNVKYRAEGQNERAERASGLFLLFYTVIGLLALAGGLLAARYCGLVYGARFTPEELATLQRVLRILTVNLAVGFPLSVFSSLISAHERFTFAKLAAIADTILTYGGILLVLMGGYRSVGMAAVTTAVSIAVKLALCWYCLGRMKLRLRFGGLDGAIFKAIFRYSAFIFLNILVDQLYNNTDKLVLGAVVGAAAVTTYTVGVQFSAYFQQLSTAVSGVYLPRITQIYAEDRGTERLSALFVRIGRIQFILLAFVLSGFIAFGQDFILLMAGPSNSRAYLIALIIMVPTVIPLSQNIGIAILQAMNRHGFRSVVYLFIALLNVALTIPLARRWSGVGAAVGTTVACLLGQWLTMNWFYYKKIGLDIPRYWREVGGIALRMLPMALPAWALNRLLPQCTWPVLFVRIVLYTLTFLPLCWGLLLNAEEKTLAGGVLRRMRGHDR